MELLLREDDPLLRVEVEEELRVVVVELPWLPVETLERLIVRAPLLAEALRVARLAGAAEEERRGAELMLLRVVVEDFEPPVTRGEWFDVPVLRRTWLEGVPFLRAVEPPDRRVLGPSVERREPK